MASDDCISREEEEEEEEEEGGRGGRMRPRMNLLPTLLLLLLLTTTSTTTTPSSNTNLYYQPAPQPSPPSLHSFIPVPSTSIIVEGKRPFSTRWQDICCFRSNLSYSSCLLLIPSGSHMLVPIMTRLSMMMMMVDGGGGRRVVLLCSGE